MNRYQYVLDDGGTIEDALVAALRDIDAALGNPRDCGMNRWQSARESAQHALRLRATHASGAE